jgi:beta-glucosidase
MGVAYIRGAQGTGKGRFDYQHILATGKHFTGYESATGGINGNYVNISRRALYTIYFPPFKAAIQQAGLASVMVAYEDLNGIPCHMNHWLLTDILRNAWGFKGFTISDNIDIYRLYSMQHTAKSSMQAAVLALKAGVNMDLDLLGSKYAVYKNTLAKAVSQGLIKESYINRAVRRVLEAKFKLGLFDNPKKEDPHKILGSPAHRKLALQVAEAAIVLLKNDGILPLQTDGYKQIAIIGPWGNQVAYGDYTGWSKTKTIPLIKAFPKYVFENTSVKFAKGASITGKDTSGFKKAINLAKKSNVVIMCIGGSQATSGEGHDRASLGLPGVQLQLFNAIRKTGTPIVVVLHNGRPLAVDTIAKQANAIIEGWYLGTESANAMSRVLTGQYNPGGKLSMTIPKSVGQLPSFYEKKPAFTGKGKGKYLNVKDTPLYPFGFGLSYTTFKINHLRLSKDTINKKGSTILSVDVTDTGKRAGDEVVQLYVHEDYASVGRYLQLLKGFRRVYLKSGETKTVSFKVGFKQLSFYNQDFKKVVEPGVFHLRVGDSSVNTHAIKLVVTNHKISN